MSERERKASKKVLSIAVTLPLLATLIPGVAIAEPSSLKDGERPLSESEILEILDIDVDRVTGEYTFDESAVKIEIVSDYGEEITMLSSESVEAIVDETVPTYEIVDSSIAIEGNMVTQTCTVEMDLMPLATRENLHEFHSRSDGKVTGNIRLDYALLQGDPWNVTGYGIQIWRAGNAIIANDASVKIGQPSGTVVQCYMVPTGEAQKSEYTGSFFNYIPLQGYDQWHGEKYLSFFVTNFYPNAGPFGSNGGSFTAPISAPELGIADYEITFHLEIPLPWS